MRRGAVIFSKGMCVLEWLAADISNVSDGWRKLRSYLDNRVWDSYHVIGDDYYIESGCGEENLECSSRYL